MRTPRETGSALVLVLFMGMALLALTVLSLDMSRSHTQADRTQRVAFRAKQIARSAASQAIARINEGGMLEPVSGTGVAPVWVTFSGGSFIYYGTYDIAAQTNTIRAWGRVATEASPSSSTVPPDDGTWDGRGWMVQGIEISIRSKVYIPEAPLYFGNGGIEKPMGGFEFTSSADPADPSTWTTVTSPISYQATSVPFAASALDHPPDFLYNGGTPAPFSTYPHPYTMFVSQNKIGQFNIEAWFNNSADTGDAKSTLQPPPTSTYYDTSDPASPDYPFPVDPNIPDVQDYSWALWNKFESNNTVNKLNGGDLSGTFGDYTTPNVTFVTGTLNVPATETFRGAGILVIRDDYDPNTDGTANTPGTKAGLTIAGTFEWTGLVIVAGWAPSIEVAVGGDATIVGTVMGEDSVQSGGETSLDSATITFKIDDDFRVLYSNDLFTVGGLIEQTMPRVTREVVGMRSM